MVHTKGRADSAFSCCRLRSVWSSRLGCTEQGRRAGASRGACKVSSTSPASTPLIPPLQAQEHVVQGHLVKINRAGPRPEHEVEQRLAERGHSLDAAVQPPALHGKGPRLYVGGIAEDLGEEKIRQVTG